MMKRQATRAKRLFLPLSASLNQNLTETKPKFTSDALPSISVCMIVRNEAHCLERCLNSVRDLATEMIIVDTGSTDDSIAIARRMGAKVIEAPWEDHYAQARNLGLAHALGEWIMVLDADEVLSPETRQLLPLYLGSYQGRDVVLNARFCSESHAPVYSRFLFPNRRGIEFASRVHEIPVLPGGELASYNCQDLLIWHESSSGEEKLARQSYYRKLLLWALSEETDPLLVNHLQKHLGLNYLESGEGQLAWQVLSDCYRGMQLLGIQPQDGFYGEVLRGLVRAGLETQQPGTPEYVRELRRYYPLEPIASQPFQPFSRRSAWKKVVAVAALTALAACQPVPTGTGPVSQTSSQTPILLKEEADFRSPAPMSSVGLYNPVLGDFGIKAAYFCPQFNSQVNACYASGGHPVIGAQDVDQDGVPCFHFDYCDGGVIPTPTPRPPMPMELEIRHLNVPAGESAPQGTVTISPQDENKAYDTASFGITPGPGFPGDPWTLEIRSVRRGVLVFQKKGKGASSVTWDGQPQKKFINPPPPDQPLPPEMLKPNGNGIPYLEDGEYDVVVSSDKGNGSDADRIFIDNTPPELVSENFQPMGTGSTKIVAEVMDPEVNGVSSGFSQWSVTPQKIDFTVQKQSFQVADVSLIDDQGFQIATTNGVHNFSFLAPVDIGSARLGVYRLYDAHWNNAEARLLPYPFETNCNAGTIFGSRRLIQLKLAYVMRNVENFDGSREDRLLTTWVYPEFTTYETVYKSDWTLAMGTNGSKPHALATVLHIESDSQGRSWNTAPLPGHIYLNNQDMPLDHALRRAERSAINPWVKLEIQRSNSSTAVSQYVKDLVNSKKGIYGYEAYKTNAVNRDKALVYTVARRIPSPPYTNFNRDFNMAVGTTGLSNTNIVNLRLSESKDGRIIVTCIPTN